MISLKLAFLSVFLLLLINNINCSEDQTTTKETNKTNETKVEDKSDEEENYDEIGEKFLSLLSEKVKMKIIKNKAANEGVLDPTKFQKEQLTKEELEEVQAALVMAMQPLFGKFVSELGVDGKDKDKDKMELDGPENAKKKVTEDKVEGEKSEEKDKTEKKSTKKTTPKKDKEEEIKEKKADKPKSKTEKETGKSDKMKKDEEKGKKKQDKGKEEKKGTKKKEEL